MEEVQFYDEEDWGELERRVNDVKLIPTLLLGLALMFGTAFIIELVSDLVYYIVFGVGVFLAFASVPYAYVTNKNVRLVKDIIELEHERGKLILPPDFEIRSTFNLPIRKEPDYSYEELEKIVESSQFMIEEKMQLWGIIFIASGIGSVIIASLFLEREWLVFLIMFLAMSPSLTYLVLNGQRRGRLDAIIKYEERSGEQVIPDELRGRIYNIDDYKK